MWQTIHTGTHNARADKGIRVAQEHAITPKNNARSENHDVPKIEKLNVNLLFAV